MAEGGNETRWISFLGVFSFISPFLACYVRASNSRMERVCAACGKAEGRRPCWVVVMALVRLAQVWLGRSQKSLGVIHSLAGVGAARAFAVSLAGIALRPRPFSPNTEH